MLDLLLLLSTAAFIAAGAVVGIRLLKLSSQTRQLPDFSVGFSLFVLAAIAYPLILVASAPDLTLDEARVVGVLSMASLTLGWAGVFFFTQRVFRPGERWAVALASGGVAMLVYGLIAGIRYFQTAPDRAALTSRESPVIWIEIAAVLVYTWTAFEGFRCWSQARRRMRLGLADPQVVNRFMLWGWIGVASLLSVGPSLAITLAGGDGVHSVFARFCTAIGGFAASISLQLAFLPPEPYRAWVQKRASAA